jgi:hypothetical protein
VILKETFTVAIFGFNNASMQIKTKLRRMMKSKSKVPAVLVTVEMYVGMEV